jgi:endo-beta-N-acetylglucosaminidase D
MRKRFYLLLMTWLAAEIEAHAKYSFIPKAPAFDPLEILSWSPSTDPDAPRNRSSVPLAQRFTTPSVAENPGLSALWNINPNARPGEAKVQAVTTFNTVPAAGTHGWRTTYLYAPTIWQYTDSMVQWGTSDRNTKVILIPSAHVIDAAHRNGVEIYGKIFFNWNAASDPVTLQKVRDLLVKSGQTFPVADKLVEAAKYFGFDGWFINQENYETTAADASNMRDFLAYFRAKAQAEGVPNLKITWYDAMAEDGSRSFQNAYTSLNDSYLKKDDGTPTAHKMFLNFWWFRDDQQLANSRSHAIARGVDPYDIHAGIWTENNRTLGNVPDENGANNIAIPWDSLFPSNQPHVHSIALYGAETPFYKGRQPAASASQDAIYWSGPNSDPANTTTDSNWKGIAHYIPANSVIRTLPFITHFNTGHGSHYRVDGETCMTGPWTNMSLQDILPTWQWTVFGPNGKSLSAGYDFSDAYKGGSSLKLTGSVAATNPQSISLYQTRLPVDAATTIRTSSKSASPGVSLELAYVFEDDPGATHYSSPIAVGSNWTEGVVELNAHAGRTLAKIGLRVSSGATVEVLSLNVGKIEVSSGLPIAPPVPTGLTIEDTAQNPDEATATMLRLKWDVSSEAVLQYNVWYRSSLEAGANRVWLGASPIPWFFAQDVRRIAVESSGFIEVDAVSPSGAVSNVSEPVAFNFQALPNLHHPVIPSYPVTAPITVIGSSNQSNRINAFDNNPTTHAEPGGADGAWVGLDLGEGNEKRITAIRFIPRLNWVNRAINGVFQGSNTPDFSSGVVQLAKIEAPPTEGVETTLAVSIPDEFRYLRYLSPSGGYANISEIKFYADGPQIAPSAPTTFQGTLLNSTASLTWSPPQSGFVSSYILLRSSSPDGPFNVLAEGLTSSSYTDTGLSSNSSVYYLVKALNENGQSPLSARLTLNPPQADRLSGATITFGTPYNSNTTNASKAFDGALNTYFESTTSQSWVGLDLGDANHKSIHTIRYSPRNSNPTNQTNANFMLGGRFQVASLADFSDAVTLHAIPSAPAYNLLTSVAVPVDIRPWRYVRYITASGRNANISELEIYGTQDSYRTWLEESGVDPDSPQSSFAGDINGDGIKNGVEYMNPTGIVSSVSSGSVSFQAVIRNDILTDTSAWESTDLINWTKVPLVYPNDQTGVPLGFSRVNSASVITPEIPRRFYRLHFSR